MATMTLTIPNDIVGDVVDAFAAEYGYQENVTTTVSGVPTQVPNPESKNSFAKRQIREHVKRVYVKHQVALVEATISNARSTAYTTVSGIDMA